jgi:hypothetical protein
MEDNHMYEYESEQVKMHFNLIKEGVKSEAISRYDDVLNKRAGEGWELVTSSFVADLAGAILITFRREKR